MYKRQADDGIAYLNFYLEEDADTEAILKDVKAALEDLRSFVDIGEATITESQTEDKDWINNWKQYFHQFYVDDILIVPSWEEVKAEDKDKMILHIDPGTAFGTGMHETTQLVIRQLKKFVKPGMEILDVGTGSGILGIVALKLGAGHVAVSYTHLDVYKRQMKEKEAEVAELRDLIIEKTDKMDKVLKKVAKVLASNTNYATMVSVPQYSGNKVKFIQLSRMSELQLVAVVVSDNNTVRNQIINLDEEMDDQTILKLNLLLNTNLNGIPIQDINLGMIARLKEQAGSHSGVVATVLDAVAATIHVEEEDMEIYTSGATNIFKYQMCIRDRIRMIFTIGLISRA